MLNIVYSGRTGTLYLIGLTLKSTFHCFIHSINILIFWFKSKSKANVEPLDWKKKKKDKKKKTKQRLTNWHVDKYDNAHVMYIDNVDI